MNKRASKIGRSCIALVALLGLVFGMLASAATHAASTCGHHKFQAATQLSHTAGSHGSHWPSSAVGAQDEDGGTKQSHDHCDMACHGSMTLVATLVLVVAATGQAPTPAGASAGIPTTPPAAYRPPIFFSRA